MNEKRQIRYAVVGLGHIAQVAVLPAFQHAGENSKLAAVVSDDPEKRREIPPKYGVEKVYSYEQYDEMLGSGEIDAVYIALPNSLHKEHAVRAARAGIHVLCEKPMAVTEQDCREMIDACRESKVKLMVGYRLHFEEANLKAVEAVQSGKLGDVRVFTSLFTLPVKEGDIRTHRETGGGTLYDIGIYCVNAARYLFRAKPLSVFGCSVKGQDPKFQEIDESTSAILLFPGDRLACFTSSFGTQDVAMYQIAGTQGVLRLEPAYEYAKTLKQTWFAHGEPGEPREFPKRDQFAAELVYFSDCILNDKQPEPSGEEGLADVRIIEALYRSSQTGKYIKLKPARKARRPSLKQEIHKPPVEKPELVHATSASGKD